MVNLENQNINVNCIRKHRDCYLRHRLVGGEGIVTLGVCVCVSAKPRLHATLVSAVKVMCCIQCCLVYTVLKEVRVSK